MSRTLLPIITILPPSPHHLLPSPLSSPGRLETIFTKSAWIEQIYVHGDSLCDHLVAVLVPSKVAATSVAEKLCTKFNSKTCEFSGRNTHSMA